MHGPVDVGEAVSDLLHRLLGVLDALRLLSLPFAIHLVEALADSILVPTLDDLILGLVDCLALLTTNRLKCGKEI